jgi:hypothetical protein
MPERATVDLDILIAAEDTQAVRAQFKDAGYEYLQELTVGGSTWRSPEGILVDVLESSEPWVHKPWLRLERILISRAYPSYLSPILSY